MSRCEEDARAVLVSKLRFLVAPQTPLIHPERLSVLRPNLHKYKNKPNPAESNGVAWVFTFRTPQSGGAGTPNDRI